MSDNLHLKKFERWYDQSTKLKQAVHFLDAFPYEIQSIVAEAISLVMEKEFKAKELAESFKSLGSDKILALYKSKNKRRSYDRNPALHKAMNYLFVLSDEGREYMASKIIELVSHLQQYFQMCKDLERNADLEGVKAVTDTYIVHGSQSVKEFLTALRQEFIAQVKSGAPQKKGPMEKIQDGSQGLKVQDSW